MTTSEAVLIGDDELPTAERTLGYAVMAWCSANLQNLDGTRWIFTDEQARFVLKWYEIDATGGWRYRRGVLRRMKGWGKDPLAATLAVCEWIGPCRFGGWQESGRPIVVREQASWIQIAAVTERQAEQNTMTLFSSIIPRRLEESERLRIGLQICWAPGRRRIQAISNSARGLEGARPTFVVETETQHWIEGNGGTQLAEVIRRNLSKSAAGKSRALAITNAHMAGENSVAERDWSARDATDVLYSSREAPAGLDLTDNVDIRRGIVAARGDSYWLPIDRIVAEFSDPAGDEAINVRFFHNRIVAGSGRWMGESTWAAAEREGEAPKEGRRITLGFDGSVRRDATALVGTDLETGWQWIVGLWERDVLDAAWEVPIEEVHAAAEEARTHWQVMRFYADPSWWEETVSRWAAAFERPDGKDAVLAWYTGGGNITRMARAVRAYMDAVEDGACTHEGSPVFTRHVMAAHKGMLKGRAGEDGLHVIRKASRASTDSIDAAMAAVLSWQACLDSRGDGDLDIPEPGRLRVHLPPGLE